MPVRPVIDVPQNLNAPSTAPLSQNMIEVNVRERSRKDPGLLDLDENSLNPNRHYRWVRCRADEHVQSVTKHKLKGYQIEQHRADGPRPVAETDHRPDNVIAIGDLILMSCPRHQHEERTARKHARTENFLRNTSAETERMAAEKGVKIIDKEVTDQQVDTSL